MKYGLIGKSLVHSYSKEIHESLGKYDYDLFSLTPEEMSGFVKARDFGGLNVTIPYKQDVMPLCDEISELAASIGAVNTLYWKDDLTAGSAQSSRKLAGHNTDYAGFLYTAKRADIDFREKVVLILGTGGTSLMARKAASDEGAAKVYVASRSGGTLPSNAGLRSGGTPPSNARLQSGGTWQAANMPDASAPANVILAYGSLHEIGSDVDIIVNTTPVGTFPNNLQSIISLDAFPNCSAAIDVIYNPFKTKLLLEAEKAGLKCANGLPMLVAQATAAAGYFLGAVGAFTGENERIIAELTRRMRNIVLIGMPGCGKTTIGKILSEKTGKALVDMDEEIVRKTGKPIPQIFDEIGEKGFRDLESETASELGKQRGLIISTGGGVILRSENVDALKQNGFMLHIKRPVDSLPTDGRPLSKDADSLREMEKLRMPLYEAAADMSFDNSIRRLPKQLADIVYEHLGSI